MSQTTIGKDAFHGYTRFMCVKCDRPFQEEEPAKKHRCPVLWKIWK